MSASGLPESLKNSTTNCEAFWEVHRLKQVHHKICFSLNLIHLIIYIHISIKPYGRWREFYARTKLARICVFVFFFPKMIISTIKLLLFEIRSWFAWKMWGKEILHKFLWVFSFRSIGSTSLNKFIDLWFGTSHHDYAINYASARRLRFNVPSVLFLYYFLDSISVFN